jgi:hypothetical protein
MKIALDLVVTTAPDNITEKSNHCRRTETEAKNLPCLGAWQEGRTFSFGGFGLLLSAQPVSLLLLLCY